ncbi:MAG: DMT family transporter [Gammaproteobacteria bacterium]|nr:DMT family transporter [Gammaproteobacteria bacterium]
MKRNHILLLILLAALWGGSFLFMRIAAPVLGPVWLIEFRSLLAGLVLLPIILLQGQLGKLWGNYRGLLVASLLNSALPFCLLAYAATELSAGLTSILNATVPIFSTLFAFLITREQLKVTKVVGVALGFTGVVILMSWRQGDMAPPSILPVVAGLVAAISYVFAANYTRSRLTEIPPLVYVTGSQLGAAILLVPLLPFFIPNQSPDTPVVFSVIGLALLSTSLAFIIYFHLIRQIGPTQTLTVTYLIPLFAIVWGSWLLDEQVTTGMLIGGILVLIGTALANGVRPGFTRNR